MDMLEIRITASIVPTARLKPLPRGLLEPESGIGPFVSIVPAPFVLSTSMRSVAQEGRSRRLRLCPTKLQVKAGSAHRLPNCNAPLCADATAGMIHKPGVRG